LIASHSALFLICKFSITGSSSSKAGGGGLFCCDEGGEPSEFVGVNSERLINHQPDSTDFVDAETIAVPLKRGPNSNHPSVYYKQIEFRSAERSGWGVQFKMDTVDNWSIHHLESGKKFSESGVQVGWKIKAINGAGINQQNWVKYMRMLYKEDPCTIMFEYHDPPLLENSGSSAGIAPKRISELVKTALEKYEIPTISHAELPLIFSSHPEDSGDMAVKNISEIERLKTYRESSSHNERDSHRSQTPSIGKQMRAGGVEMPTFDWDVDQNVKVITIHSKVMSSDRE